MIRLKLEQNTKIERSAVNETTLLPGTITECCTTSEAESTGSQMIFVSVNPTGCPEAPEGAQRYPKVRTHRYPKVPKGTNPTTSKPTQQLLTEPKRTGAMFPLVELDLPGHEGSSVLLVLSRVPGGTWRVPQGTHGT